MSTSTKGLVVKPLKPLAPALPPPFPVAPPPPDAGAPPTFTAPPPPTTPLPPLPEAPPAIAPARGGSLLALFLGVVLLAVAVLASWVLSRELSRWQSALDEQAFVQANQALEQSLEEKRQRALASVKLLVDDTRVRATVVTPNFDEATVTDVLDDLRTAAGAAVVAVLNVAGKVQARSGGDLLKQIDLGSVTAVKKALDGPAAAVWTMPEQVLVMAVAPIQSGREVAALLMLGFELGPAALDGIERLGPIAGAVLIGSRVVATGTRQPGLQPVFEAALALPEAGGVIAAGGRELLVRSTRTGESAMAARVTWALPRHHRAMAMRGFPAVIWAAAILVAMMLVLVALLVRRR